MRIMSTMDSLIDEITPRLPLNAALIKAMLSWQGTENLYSWQRVVPAILALVI